MNLEINVAYGITVYENLDLEQGTWVSIDKAIENTHSLIVSNESGYEELVHMSEILMLGYGQDLSIHSVVKSIMQHGEAYDWELSDTLDFIGLALKHKDPSEVAIAIIEVANGVAEGGDLDA